jgi:hypothetical protein
MKYGRRERGGERKEKKRDVESTELERVVEGDVCGRLLQALAKRES